MQKRVRVALWATVGIVLPNIVHAEDGGIADNIKSLHSVLDQLYDEMIPMCSQLTGVARGLAGFAAMWYIAVRVWRHIANAEPVDFYPLFRPFALGLCIVAFPAVIGLINGVLSPIVTGTSAMVTNSDAAIATLLKQKEDAVKSSDIYQMYVGETGSGDRDKWYKYTHPDEDPSDESWYETIGNDVRFAMAKASYNFRNAIKEWMSEVLQVLFAAASLAINTIRTFNLIILAILGPLVFGLSVFDGFQHSLKHWLSRYVNVFLWLPVCNIFGAVIGKIQENMLKIDIGQINQTGDTFFSKTDAGYLIFMIIGIIGYFTVPSIASHIMWVGGGDALTAKSTGGLSMATNTAITTVTSATSAVGSAVGSAANSVAAPLVDAYRNPEQSTGNSARGDIGASLGKLIGDKKG